MSASNPSDDEYDCIRWEDRPVPRVAGALLPRGRLRCERAVVLTMKPHVSIGEYIRRLIAADIGNMEQQPEDAQCKHE